MKIKAAQSISCNTRCKHLPDYATEAAQSAARLKHPHLEPEQAETLHRLHRARFPRFPQSLKMTPREASDIPSKGSLLRALSLRISLALSSVLLRWRMRSVIALSCSIWRRSRSRLTAPREASQTAPLNANSRSFHPTMTVRASPIHRAIGLSQIHRSQIIGVDTELTQPFRYAQAERQRYR